MTSACNLRTNHELPHGSFLEFPCTLVCSWRYAIKIHTHLRRKTLHYMSAIGLFLLCHFCDASSSGQQSTHSEMCGISTALPPLSLGQLTREPFMIVQYHGTCPPCNLLDSLGDGPWGDSWKHSFLVFAMDASCDLYWLRNTCILCNNTTIGVE